MTPTGLGNRAGLALLLLAWPAVASGALVQSYQSTGPLGLEVAAASNLAGALPSFSGTLSLSSMPPGAVVQKAFLYAHDWGSSGALDLVLNLASIGLMSPFQSDTTTVITHLFAYRWDVTPFIHGPGPYSVAIGQSSPGNQIAGAALAVVWLDPLAPPATVTIVDGAKQVGEHGAETEAAAFAGLPPGPTALWLFTVSDDVVGSGEVVRYNGTAVGGPIDENLGLGASLLQLGATSVSGANTVSVSTGSDHFGWLLAATHVPVPTPPAPALVLLGGWLLWRRRRRCPPSRWR